MFKFILLSVLLTYPLAADGITKVVATRDSLILSGQTFSSMPIEELEPWQSPGTGHTVAITPAAIFTVTLPRFDGPRDRIYSAFSIAGSKPRFVEEMSGLDRNEEPYPVAQSKKGLQVADVSDALALGIKHAALNAWLQSYIDLESKEPGPTLQLDGRTFHFHRQAIEGLDRQVKTLSDAGVVVTLILVYRRSGDPAEDKLMLHPDFDPSGPNGITAFNLTNAESTEEFKACVEFLAQRYSRPDHAFGRALNFIVGNEVDSHWYWYNLGHAEMPTVAEQYARAVRLCDTAVHKYCAAGRVFISLDHFWNMRYPKSPTTQTCAGRQLVEEMHRILSEGGDIDWNVAFHPYPENLFKPRFWDDKTATFEENTKRITFKNIEMLPHFLDQPQMLYHGQARHVILSEQGFHTYDEPDGEAVQAAAYACAYYRVNQIPGIDAFILHRQFDAAGEGGLHLGLWWEADTNPHHTGRQKKKIYEVFRAADTEHWREAFEFALPIIGIRDWSEENPRTFP